MGEPEVDVDELREHSRHVYYEWSMLRETADLLLTGNLKPPLLNAVIESFAVHARALTDFLHLRPYKSQPGDVTARSFLSGWNLTAVPELKDLVNQVNKQVAHLTSKRSMDPAEKEWHPREIFNLLLKPMKQFQEQAGAAGLLDSEWSDQPVTDLPEPSQGRSRSQSPLSDMTQAGLATPSTTATEPRMRPEHFRLDDLDAEE